MATNRFTGPAGRTVWTVLCGLAMLLSVLAICIGFSLPADGTIGDITYGNMELAHSPGKAGSPVIPRVYATPSPSLSAGFGLYRLPVGRESNLRLFENGVLLNHEVWKGDLYPSSYLHFEEQILFLPTRDSDPRLDGNVYTYKVRYFLKFRLQIIFFVTFVFAAAGFSFGLSHLPGSPWRRGRTRDARRTDSPKLSVVAAVMAPVLFFIGNNLNYYPSTTLVVSLFAAFGLSLLLALGLRGLRAVVGRFTKMTSRYLPEGAVRLLSDAPTACEAFVALVAFFLFSGFALHHLIPERMPLHGAIFMILSLSSALAAASLFLPVARFLGVLFLSALAVTSAGFLCRLPERFTKEPVAVISGDIQEIEFVVKPSIYLFFLESYAGLDFISEFYGVDVAPFQRDLKARGFYLRDIFANRTATLESAATLMAMRQYDAGKYRAGLMDAKREVRDMITGKAYNPALTILKQNNYIVSFLHMTYYLLQEESPAINITNLSLIRSPSEKLQALTNALGPFSGGFGGLNILQRADDFFPAVKEIIGQTAGSPSFHFIYTGLDHNYMSHNHPVWMARYPRLYELFNSQLLDLLDYIEEVDPDGLIILIGDHGSKLFGEEFGISSLDYEEFLSSGLGDAATIARDKASVFFAIKSPVRSEIWKNRTISHANLFRLIFSMLSNDESLLQNCEPDISIWNDYVIVRDGTPLRKWEPVNPG